MQHLTTRNPPAPRLSVNVDLGLAALLPMELVPTGVGGARTQPRWVE